MKARFSRKMLFIVVLLGGAVTLFTFSTNRQTVDFNTQVKPIFNKKCITCHGGVRRKADFSLLFRADALSKTKSGKYAIVPGDPEHSEMIRRISLHDPEDRMPYKHDPLSAEEISILRRWISQGAPWGDHWAFVAVKPVEIPGIKNDWIKNEIDPFIYDKLKQEKLKPSIEADKATLLRRASLDLIGMPAPKHLAQTFLNDHSDKAYERLVDSLLASPHHFSPYNSSIRPTQTLY